MAGWQPHVTSAGSFLGSKSCGVACLVLHLCVCMHVNAYCDVTALITCCAIAAICIIVAGAAGDIMCPLGVTNIGTVRLRDVSIQGPQNNCTVSGMMYPGETLNCTLHRTVNQTDYDVREADSGNSTELSVAANTFGASNVTWTTLNTSLPTPLFSQLSLPIDRNMTATATLSRSFVNVTGEPGLFQLATLSPLQGTCHSVFSGVTCVVC